MSHTKNQSNQSNHTEPMVNSVELLGTKLSVSVLISCEEVQCILRV